MKPKIKTLAFYKFFVVENSKIKWNPDHYILNVLIALFVTFLWSSSFVIIKWGLEDIPPIIFSGLRYSIASILLVILLVTKNSEIQTIKTLSKLNLVQILIYGFIFVFLTQGLQFLGLYFLPAISFTMILNLTIILVLIFSNILLKESFSKLDVIFIGFTLLGVYLYFDDKISIEIELIGLGIGLAALVANSGSTIFGRYLNRQKIFSPLLITGISMSFGSIILLFIGLIFEQFPKLSLTNIIYIFWLAIFNTALAFTLWNFTMGKLRAIDSALINSTMLPQIVVLSFVFLNETPNFIDWVGIIIVAISIIVIQVNQSKKNSSEEN